MLFSSYQFILIFLPVCWLVYFTLNKFRLTKLGLAWLTLMSLFFYGYDEPVNILLIIVSSIINRYFGANLTGARSMSSVFERKLTLLAGILINLGVLGYFKYADFFIENFNFLLGSNFALVHNSLPLGISFFTFQQIAYLVDSYRRETSEYNFVNYLLFVTFFPQLIAGPIVHHKEIIPQLNSIWRKAIRYPYIQRGLYIFGIGLFKKLILADTFAIWVGEGFDNPEKLDFITAWVTSLCYTFQIYFDFSGYCDMAVGLGYLFNISIPMNFNSPYKSNNIQEFWRRWHITLSRFLRDYFYIPLGGSRCSFAREQFNLLIVFVWAGLWHGASWMFVIWGALHGCAMILHRIWTRFGFQMSSILGWILTFNFVNLTWIFFRAKSIDDALRILHGMLDVGSLVFIDIRDLSTQRLAWGGSLFESKLWFLSPVIQANILPLLLIAISFVFVAQRNAFELSRGRIMPSQLWFGLILLIIGTYASLISSSELFLYFNF
jgi:alginate O-acetyltransferase complex protein AlgI